MASDGETENSATIKATAEFLTTTLKMLDLDDGCTIWKTSFLSE